MAFPKRMTLSERAYYEIKSMIARREISPGAPLVLQSLATRFGMSRMPVVEAIRRLERDGLVTLVPQWGATVKVWSEEEIREAHSIRRALEGEAARLFVARATPEDKRHLANLSDKFDRWAAKDTFRCDEADLEFHLHIVRCTRYQRLFELVENSKIGTTIISGFSLAVQRRHGNAKQVLCKEYWHSQTCRQGFAGKGCRQGGQGSLATH
jgi:DNA-binding GntR family transcriptional regulator